MKLKLSYKEAFDRITTAYINDELNPWDCSSCFIGNLLQSYEWFLVSRGLCTDVAGMRLINSFGYNLNEIYNLERNFLSIIVAGISFTEMNLLINRLPLSSPYYENALYQAMVSTLEMLKEIHIAAGEDVDQSLSLVKRILQAA